MKRQRCALGLWLLLGVGMVSYCERAVAATVEAASKAEIKTATECYERGVAAMDADKYAEALAQFQKSYETVSSPNSRMMVGRALVKLGRLPEAHRELSRAIGEATTSPANQKKYKKTIETAQKELDDIKDKLAYLTVRHGAKLQLQGQAVAASDWNAPQPVMPGTLLVEVTFTDGRQLQKQLTLKAGERTEFVVDTPAPTSPDAPGVPKIAAAPASSPTGERPSGMSRPTVGYLFGGVGILGLGTFVGFGLIAASSYGNPRALCNTQICPQSALDDQASKSTFQGIGYAGLGVGILGLGIGTWLVLSGDPTSKTATALQLGPTSVQVVQRF